MYRGAYFQEGLLLLFVSYGVCLDVDSDNDFNNISGMVASVKTMSTCFNDYSDSRQLENAALAPIATTSKDCI